MMKKLLLLLPMSLLVFGGAFAQNKNKCRIICKLPAPVKQEKVQRIAPVTTVNPTQYETRTFNVTTITGEHFECEETVQVKNEPPVIWDFKQPVTKTPVQHQYVKRTNCMVDLIVNKPAEKKTRPCIQTCCNCPCYDSDGNVVYHKRFDQINFNFQPENVTKLEANERPERELMDKQVITKTMAIQQPVDNVIIDGINLIDPYPANEDGNVFINGRMAPSYNPVNDQPIAGLQVVQTQVDNVKVVDGRFSDLVVAGNTGNIIVDVPETHNPVTIVNDISTVTGKPNVRCKCKKVEPKVPVEVTKIDETIVDGEIDVKFTETPEEQTILWGEVEGLEAIEEHVDEPVVNIIDELTSEIVTEIEDEEVELIVDEPIKPLKPCKLTGDLQAIHIVSRRVEIEIVDVNDEPEAPADEEADPTPVDPIVLPIVSKGDMTVYPNPAIHFVNVKWDGDETLDMVHVFDMTGKLVRSERAYNNKVQFEKNELTKGMYLVRAINQKGEVLKVDRFSFQ